MTENKRFENRLNTEDIRFNTQNPVWDNEKEDALNVFEMIDLLNDLNDKNKFLSDFRGFIDEEHQKLKEENTELKKQLKDCQQKKQNIKDVLMNSKPVVEQKKLQKLIYQVVINMIDEKIKENRPTMLAVKIPKECADKRVCLHNHEVNVASMAKYNILNELKEELKGAADD